MLNGNDILAVNPVVATQDTGDELVVVLPDQGKYVVLNSTGALVMKHADGQQTLDEIAAAIAHDFGTGVEQVKKDVLTFAENLVSRGILTIVATDEGDRNS